MLHGCIPLVLERLQLREGTGGTAGQSTGGEHCGLGLRAMSSYARCISPEAGGLRYKCVDRGFACPEGLRCESIEYKLLRLTAD